MLMLIKNICTPTPLSPCFIHLDKVGIPIFGHFQVSKGITIVLSYVKNSATKCGSILCVFPEKVLKLKNVDLHG